MGNESVVYGAIVGSRWHISDSQRLQRLNQQVIASLPETDDWPFLTRPMFALAGTQPQTGTYRSQPIFFGATFKAVEWEWDAWLAKFESLLMRLFWDAAYLHLRTEGTVGDYDYTYRAEHPDSYYADEQPRPVHMWSFSGGPRAFDYEGEAADDATDQVWQFANGVWTRMG